MAAVAHRPAGAAVVYLRVCVHSRVVDVHVKVDQTILRHLESRRRARRDRAYSPPDL